MISSFDRLKDSKEFKDWIKKNKDAYLVSCFTTLHNRKGVWQFDFYLPKINKMTSFILDKKIEVNEEEKIFKKSKGKLKKLELNKVKITLDDALKIISKLDKYKKTNFTKEFVILQNLDKIIWNLSLLDDKFNVLNLKIDAISGKIVNEFFESLLKMKAS